MHLLIYDPQYAGHHLNHVKWIATAYENKADRITFATSAETPSSKEFAEFLNTVPSQFVVDATIPWRGNDGGSFGSTKVGAIAWAGLNGAIERHRPDHVIVCYGDDLLMTPAVRFPRSLRLRIAPERIDATIFAAGFAYQQGMPLRPRLRAKVKLLGLAALPIGRYMFIDGIAHDWIVAHRPKLAPRCVPCPDPVGSVFNVDKQTARRRLGIPTDGRFISCIGLLDGRKGIDDFVTEFAAASLGPTDRLLLAGRTAPEVRNAVERARQKVSADRIVILDRHLSGEEFNLALSAADLVAVTHRFPDHIGSASILILAAKAGRPVIASEMGWPGLITRKYNLGEIYPTGAAARPGAIARALESATSYAPSAATEEFVRFHTVEGFMNVVSRTEPEDVESSRQDALQEVLS